MLIEKNLFVRFRIIRGNCYLTDGKFVYQLDEVGKFIWETIDDEVTLEDLVSHVAKKFNVNAPDIYEDIQLYINDMKRENLVV